jgi:tRNA(fMet)-specific endonuclease VapC
VTEPSFLLDTNILVYLVAGNSDPLRDQVEQRPPGSLVTSALCVAEALYGMEESVAVRSSFDRLLQVVEPQPFGLAAARAFPSVPFRRGKLDRLIAAHTLALGLTLVTNNEADFEDIPELRVENWTRRR